MATAAKTETVVTTNTVTLTLTMDEATALFDVLYHVGGSPGTTRRSLTNNVSAALQEIGFSHADFASRPQDTLGSISFTGAGGSSF